MIKFDEYKESQGLSVQERLLGPGFKERLLSEYEEYEESQLYDVSDFSDFPSSPGSDYDSSEESETYEGLAKILDTGEI